MRVPTFKRQIDHTQAWLLGALGLDAGDPVSGLDDSAILNPDDVARLIAVETVARVFRAAAALDPADQALAARASLYTDEVAAARHCTRAMLDLDGDGVADATRRVDVVAAWLAGGRPGACRQNRRDHRAVLRDNLGSG